GPGVTVGAQKAGPRRGAKGEQRVMRGRLRAGSGAVDLIRRDDVANDIAIARVKPDCRGRQAVRDAVRHIAELDAARRDRGKPFGVEFVFWMEQDREGLVQSVLRSR